MLARRAAAWHRRSPHPRPSLRAVKTKAANIFRAVKTKTANIFRGSLESAKAFHRLYWLSLHVLNRTQSEHLLRLLGILQGVSSAILVVAPRSQQNSKKRTSSCGSLESAQLLISAAPPRQRRRGPSKHRPRAVKTNAATIFCGSLESPRISAAPPRRRRRPPLVLRVRRAAASRPVQQGAVAEISEFRDRYISLKRDFSAVERPTV